jgi:hypothetical protein
LVSGEDQLHYTREPGGIHAVGQQPAKKCFQTKKGAKRICHLQWLPKAHALAQQTIHGRKRIFIYGYQKAVIVALPCNNKVVIIVMIAFTGIK